MTPQERLRRIQATTERLRKAIEECPKIAKALLRNGRALQKDFGYSDFEFIRGFILKTTVSIRLEIAKLKKQHVKIDGFYSSSLVTTDLRIVEINRCCSDCLISNRKRAEEGLGFECRVEQTRERSNDSEWKLDEDGNIHEG